MEQDQHASAGSRDNRTDIRRHDRYDNDPTLDRPVPETGHDHHRAHLDRTLKHAAWRTGMASRLRGHGHPPARPEGAF